MEAQDQSIDHPKIATKPRLSGNMLPNIKTCENGRSNFSEKLKLVALILLELTRFLSQNLSIYFNFVRCWVRCDRRRFSVHSPWIEKSMPYDFEVTFFYTSCYSLATLWFIWLQDQHIYYCNNK